jgi:hypothetical protein
MQRLVHVADVVGDGQQGLLLAGDVERGRCGPALQHLDRGQRRMDDVMSIGFASPAL